MSSGWGISASWWACARSAPDSAAAYILDLLTHRAAQLKTRIRSVCFPNSPETTFLAAYAFPTMLVTCSHLKLLPIPAAISVWTRPAANDTRRRLATAAPPQSQFPYPSHPRPTPYQIFHLPKGASQKQVKARCESLRPRGLSSKTHVLKRTLERLRTRSGAPPGFCPL